VTGPAGISPAAYKQALTDVRGLRHLGTYRTKPEKLPPVSRDICGTRRGYGKHQRAGEVTCGRCRGANAAADRRLATTGTGREATP
jgi:hypothetical protein